MSTTSTPEEIPLMINSIISGDFGSYIIRELKGAGTYAEVVRCRDLSTNQNVAIKISRYYSNAKHEASLLRQLSDLSHKKNVVKFIKSFKYCDLYCIVLEHLDKSLYDLMCERKKKPLHILDIRHITEQLLVTFKELAKRRLVHADLKLDNIMLVKHKTKPFRVKLIDFGVTTTVSALAPGQKLQAVPYRAPEVSLGLEMNEAIDMWALGCVLSYLYQGQTLFPISEYENIRVITQILGMPDLKQLRDGIFTYKFFTTRKGMYRLRSRDNYTAKSGINAEPWRNRSRHFHCLEDMMGYHPKPCTEIEKVLTRQFFDLLNKLLQVNPEKRITAAKALKHPFIKRKIQHRMDLIRFLRFTARSSSPQKQQDDLPSSGSSDLSSSTESSAESETSRESNATTDDSLDSSDAARKLQIKTRDGTPWVKYDKERVGAGKPQAVSGTYWPDRDRDSGYRKQAREVFWNESNADKTRKNNTGNTGKSRLCICLRKMFSCISAQE